MVRLIIAFFLIFFSTISYGQSSWDKIELLVDKFNNKKEYFIVHYTANEIDAVWYESDQILKYIGTFPSEEAYKFTEAYADMGRSLPKESNVLASVNRSGNVEENLQLKMSFPEISCATFDYSYFLWIPMTTEQMKQGSFLGCKYLNWAETSKYHEARYTELNISLEGFAKAYNKYTQNEVTKSKLISKKSKATSKKKLK